MQFTLFLAEEFLKVEETFSKVEEAFEKVEQKMASAFRLIAPQQVLQISSDFHTFRTDLPSGSIK